MTRHHRQGACASKARSNRLPNELALRYAGLTRLALQRLSEFVTEANGQSISHGIECNTLLATTYDMSQYPNHRGKVVVSAGIYVMSSTPMCSTITIGSTASSACGTGLLKRYDDM